MTSPQPGIATGVKPANDNSEMVPLWVCIRRMGDPAQLARASRRKVNHDD